MTSTLEPPTAGDVYTAAIEPRRRERFGTVIAGVLDLWCATFGGRFELTNEGRVVVRGRHDGSLELSIPAGGPDGAAHLLAVMRDQLATQSPEQFREGWGIA
ncbi:hypothetical protein HMPREF0063_10258 [Aeromicrobium marinum DSM 15272]|uniref:DUF2218 domain-containing protein n=1 Tax=Aeromicrobium marinum DSM 15272 TaxID=585531 RepID=E2S8A1_9ACTN|nr:hypothetical protein [Aeromicrobium marinum]EFQ84406.1 hypothetical protein HMPREF0063_10258 [Aeromicrobium marinum DSM 15272]